MHTLRLATLADLPRLVGIDNQAIASGIANAYSEPFTMEARRGWFEAHSPAAHPIYVCELDGRVAGYLSISPYRDRPALARTGEISYYVDYELHGKGIGSALMQYAFADCGRIGKHVLLAIVLEWNTGSIHLLEKFGFEKWGYLPEVAEFKGRLCGQYYYGKRLTTG
jgi:L-amino acid N-acyltransferase YncA